MITILHWHRRSYVPTIAYLSSEYQVKQKKQQCTSYAIGTYPNNDKWVMNITTLEGSTIQPERQQQCRVTITHAAIAAQNSETASEWNVGHSYKQASGNAEVWKYKYGNRCKEVRTKVTETTRMETEQKWEEKLPQWKALKNPRRSSACDCTCVLTRIDHCFVTFSCLPCAFCFVPAYAQFAQRFHIFRQ